MVKEIDWVVVDTSTNPQTFLCENCGAREPLPSRRMGIDKFVALGDSFTRRHRDCRPGPVKHEGP